MWRNGTRWSIGMNSCGRARMNTTSSEMPGNVNKRPDHSILVCSFSSMGARERLASALHDTGALGAFMQLRRLAPIPSTISILTYHHIAEDDPHYRFDPGVADATPEQFRRQMQLCCKYASPIGIDQLVDALDGAPLPKNPVMVTFDDGY